MKRFLFVSLALVGVMAAAPSAHAVPLAPGVGFTPDISAVYDSFTLGGGGALDPVTLVAKVTGALAPPPAGTQKFFGTYTEWVYRNNAGTLDFIYQINLNGSTTTAMTRVTATAFGSPITTDVGVLTAGLPPGGVAGGILPNDALDVVDRSGAASDAGATIGWNFKNTPVTAGNSSAILVVATNQLTIEDGGVLSGIDGSTTSNNVLQPGPEPSTTVLAGLGALGFIGYALRRRKALGA
jgi:hypothetical protein